jgi:ribosomal-protein-alanine N-acetyltransferase
MLVLIRTASPDDVPAIRALEQQADTAAHWAERDYDALFADDAPARIVLVATDLNDVAAVLGFLIARCAADGWEMENVVVGPKERNRGIASEMMRELLTRAREAAATSVLLEVRESNAAARRLYEKLGFSVQGRRRQYYRDPNEDALLLQLPITVS